MAAAEEYDSVRSTADTESVYDGRIIPAGMRGAVLDAKPGGSILAEFAFASQTADSDGDFVSGRPHRWAVRGRPGLLPEALSGRAVCDAHRCGYHVSAP